MKITKIETIQIETPRYYGHISGHVLVKVHVDDGPVGWGEASDSKADDLGAIAKQYNELLRGQDAGNIGAIHQLLWGHRFNSTVSDRHLVSAIDLALYDFNGNGITAQKTIEPTRSFQDDEESEGFDNIGQQLVMSDFLLKMLLGASEEVIDMATHKAPPQPFETETFTAPICTPVA